MRVAIMCVCFLMALAAGRAVAAKSIAELSEAERKQVNEWMVERARTIVSVSKLESEMENAWEHTKYSSPEIDALRAKYRELQAQLVNTQNEMRQKVLELPELRDKRQQLAELKGKVKELTDKVEEKVSLPK